MGTGKRRWLASERVAFRLLEERGFKILETRHKLVIDDVEVGEADAVAIGPDGARYVVEVKAGRVDVHAIRQVYTAALIENSKPLIVAKGFADDAARKLAEKLGVKVIELEDVFLIDAEELEEIVYGAVVEGMSEALLLLLNPPVIPPERLIEVSAIAGSRSLVEAAKKLNKKPSDLKDALNLIKDSSPIARRGGWRGIMLTARLIITGLRLRAALDSLTETAENLSKLKI